MPMATPELAAKFEDDNEAMKVIEAKGWREVQNGVLWPPYVDHFPSGREAEAVQYLVDEWDFTVFRAWDRK